MRQPCRPELMLVNMCAVEFGYYLEIHKTLKLRGMPSGDLLAKIRRDLEISIALHNGHRRVYGV